jgi:hypothetical protein
MLKGFLEYVKGIEGIPSAKIGKRDESSLSGSFSARNSTLLLPEVKTPTSPIDIVNNPITSLNGSALSSILLQDPKSNVRNDQDIHNKDVRN